MEGRVNFERGSHRDLASKVCATPQPSHPTSRIRLAEARDLPYLVTIENACFAGDKLSKRCLRDHLYRTNSELLVSVDANDIPCGYALLAYRPRARMARLDSLAVLPLHGSTGLGSDLLACCEHRAQARGIGLRFEVREDNRHAIAFYERRHFCCFGKIPDYYEDGQAALLFYKPVGS